MSMTTSRYVEDVRKQIADGLEPNILTEARRTADRYIGRDGSEPSAEPTGPKKKRLSDAEHLIARFVFGTPIGSSYGNVERGHCIAALATITNLAEEELRRIFEPPSKPITPMPRPSTRYAKRPR